MRKFLVMLACAVLVASSIDAAKPKKKTKTSQPAPTSQSVRNQRTANNRAMRETSKKIEVNEAATARQLDSLNRLRSEIQDIDASIATLSATIATISHNIDSLNTAIDEHEQLVTTLKKHYVKAMRRFKGRKHSTSKVAFVMASETFGQAYRRTRFLRRFSRWCDSKTRHIRQVQEQLAAQRNELSQLQAQRETSLAQVNAHRGQLQHKRMEQNRLVASLQAEGSALRAVLKQQEQRARQLDQELDRIIAQEQAKRAAEERRRKKEAQEALARKKKEEQRKRDEEAKRLKEEEQRKQQQAKQDKKDKKKSDNKKTEAKPSKKPDTKPQPKPQTQPETKPQEPELATSAEAKLTGDFASNKGRLPYPVGSYRIVKRFGRHAHPELKYVETNNTGIDLETSANAAVRAVFEGTVTAAFRQPGYDGVVMIRHGSYITIYAGMSAVNVQVGQKVKGNQNIGTVAPNAGEGGRYILHFELRKEREKLNPEAWLR